MIEKIMKYGAEVWSNIKMDGLRKKECLCFNCEERDKNCLIAKKTL